MTQKRPRRKRGKNYWDPFSAYLKDAWACRKGDFKVPLQALIGAPVVILIGAHLFWLSATCWEDQWKQAVLLLVLAETIPFVIVWVARGCASFYAVCREERFRNISWDMIKVVMFEVVCVLAWGIFFWHYCYIQSPHFELAIRGRCIIVNVTDFPGATPSHPTSDVVCESIAITNKYAPAMPEDWKAVAKVSSCTRLVGKPQDHNLDFGSVHSPILQGTFIFSDHAKQEMRMMGVGHGVGNVGLGNGNRVSAPAAFVFEGVREETLMSPAVTITIECCHGAKVKVPNLVTVP